MALEKKNKDDKLDSNKKFEIKIAHDEVVGDGDLVMNRDGHVFLLKERQKYQTEEMELSMTYDDDGVERSYGVLEYDNLSYIKINESDLDKLDEEVLEILNGKELPVLEEPETAEESTELMDPNSKKALENVKEDLLEKAKHFEALQRIMMKKLEHFRHKLNGIVSVYKKKLEKVMSVLYTIELYLGIYEDIYQLSKGEKASQDEPIYLRQQLLYMDEEVGICDNQGIGADDIEHFDNWVVDNLEELIPEKKCVVAFKVRRNKKEYGDPFLNYYKGLGDDRTYLLIRNGDCLYRVWTNINFSPRLFPKKEEIIKMYEKLDKNEHWREREQEEIEDTVLKYKRNLIILQGLIDRTDVFTPLKHHVNLFNMDTHGDVVKMVYDDENLLPTGRLPFKEWQKEINDKVERGSRVMFIYDYSIGSPHSTDRDYYSGRFYKYYRYYPSAPADGLYTVEEIVKEEDSQFVEDSLKILYRRTDTIWAKDEQYGGHHYREPKTRTAFKLYRDDWFVLNYDRISLDDIDFYLSSRVDRQNYLKMLPILKTLKKMRLEEIEWEKEFVRMTVEEMIRSGLTIDEKAVWDAIDWWKHKVIWKRPIAKDDAKALRMIKAKLIK